MYKRQNFGFPETSCNRYACANDFKITLVISWDTTGKMTVGPFHNQIAPTTIAAFLWKRWRYENSNLGTHWFKKYSLLCLPLMYRSRYLFKVVSLCKRQKFAFPETSCNRYACTNDLIIVISWDITSNMMVEAWLVTCQAFPQPDCSQHHYRLLVKEVTLRKY